MLCTAEITFLLLNGILSLCFEFQLFVVVLSINVYFLEPYTRIKSSLPILLPLNMQIPANNKRPGVEILAVSFCQSGKKARVFWKFTLSDVVHLQHDGGNDAKDFGSVPNLDGLEMSRYMR